MFNKILKIVAPKIARAQNNKMEIVEEIGYLTGVLGKNIEFNGTHFIVDNSKISIHDTVGCAALLAVLKREYNQ